MGKWILCVGYCGIVRSDKHSRIHIQYLLMSQFRIQRVMQVVTSCQNTIVWAGLALMAVLRTWMCLRGTGSRQMAAPWVCSGGRQRNAQETVVESSAQYVWAVYGLGWQRLEWAAGSRRWDVDHSRLAGWRSVMNARPLRVMEMLRCQTTLLLSGSSRQCYSLYDTNDNYSFDERRRLLRWSIEPVSLYSCVGSSFSLLVECFLAGWSYLAVSSSPCVRRFTTS